MELSNCNSEDSDILGKVMVLASLVQGSLNSSISLSTYDVRISGAIDKDDGFPYRLTNVVFSKNFLVCPYESFVDYIRVKSVFGSRKY